MRRVRGSGLDQFKHPAVTAKAATPLLETVGPRLGLPDDPELLIRANGMAMVGAGSLLALGHLPRLASAVLAATSAFAVPGEMLVALNP